MFEAVITAAKGFLTRATVVIEYRDDRTQPPSVVLTETYTDVDVSTAPRRQEFIARVQTQLQDLKASEEALQLQAFVGKVIAKV